MDFPFCLWNQLENTFIEYVSNAEDVIHQIVRFQILQWFWLISKEKSTQPNMKVFGFKVWLQ